MNKNKDEKRLKRLVNRPELKEWLTFSPYNNGLKPLFCKYCYTTLRAHLNDLKKHKISKRHRKAIIKQNAIGDISLWPEVLIKIEDVSDTCKGEAVNGNIPEDFCTVSIKTNEVENTPIISSINPSKVGFVGTGRFTQSLVGGLLTTYDDPIIPEDIIVSAPTHNNLIHLHPLGVQTTTENYNVFMQSYVVFLAVKPDHIAEVLDEIPSFGDIHSPLFVSCIAGLSIARLETMLENILEAPRIIRISCNTASLVQKASCVYSLGHNATDEDEVTVRKIMSKVGICKKVQEKKIDIFFEMTAAGGFAAVYSTIQAMIDRGKYCGLTPNEALKFAAQTVIGAGQMVLETKRQPKDLEEEINKSLVGSAMDSERKIEIQNYIKTAITISTERCKESS